ncbi:hypothetical protein EMCRGX_G017091 [Ephydatia muelleri]
MPIATPLTTWRAENVSCHYGQQFLPRQVMAVESGKFEFKLEIKANRRVLCIWLPTNTLPKYCCLWMLKDWRASSNRLTKGPANSLLSHVFHLLQHAV